MHHRLKQSVALSVDQLRKQPRGSRVILVYENQVLDVLLFQKGKKALRVARRVGRSQKLLRRNARQSEHCAFVAKDAGVRIRSEVITQVISNGALRGILIQKTNRADKLDAGIKSADDHNCRQESSLQVGLASRDVENCPRH